MKKKRIKVKDQIQNPKKTFYAYGSNSPLKLPGAFKSVIDLAGRSQNAVFYVVENGTRNLLAALGVFKTRNRRTI